MLIYNAVSMATVNSEIFVRVLFSRNGEIILSFTTEGKAFHSREFLHSKYVL